MDMAVLAGFPYVCNGRTLLTEEKLTCNMNKSVLLAFTKVLTLDFLVWLSSKRKYMGT